LRPHRTGKAAVGVMACSHHAFLAGSPLRSTPFLVMDGVISGCGGAPHTFGR
jgi:hypothetical protein